MHYLQIHKCLLIGSKLFWIRNESQMYDEFYCTSWNWRKKTTISEFGSSVYLCHLRRNFCIKRHTWWWTVDCESIVERRISFSFFSSSHIRCVRMYVYCLCTFLSIDLAQHYGADTTLAHIAHNHYAISSIRIECSMYEVNFKVSLKFSVYDENIINLLNASMALITSVYKIHFSSISSPKTDLLQKHQFVNIKYLIVHQYTLFSHP